ncbi:hypothetical protein CJ030_MR2G024663 [Morella rubra]|uniref:Uncharacterized protein n=1 Tax=Morella rubra TaxID=262757 RepID=A0A6A1WDH4_9ROSI|nr:hypothetical protein CJ030_MR2G024663 [Morella rubra]
MGPFRFVVSGKLLVAVTLGKQRDFRTTSVPKPANEQEGRPTKAEVFWTMLGDDTTILDGAYMVYGQLRPFWRIMHLILCSAIDPRKHTMELSYSRVEFLYLVVFGGYLLIWRPTSMSVHAEALKTDAITSLLHGILLTQFLYPCWYLRVLTSRGLPLGSINKTMLSKSIAQTHRALNAARAARVRRQEQPEEAGEQQDPWQSSTQGFGAQRPPTNEMVNDISCWLTTLEQKVMDMDSGWKKEIAAVQEAMRKAATSAELFALTQRVVHICDILKITNDDDYDL